jgi:hypothetical protein
VNLISCFSLLEDSLLQLKSYCSLQVFLRVFGRLFMSRNLSILKFPIYWSIQSFKIFCSDPLDFSGICYNICFY